MKCELLTTSQRVTSWHELPVMSGASLNPPDHEVGCAQPSRNPPSNGSGTHMVMSEKISKAQLSYVKKLLKCVCVFSRLEDMMVGGIVTLLLSSFGNSAWYEKAWLGVKWQGVDLWRLILIVSLMNWAPPLGGPTRASLGRNNRADSCTEPVLPFESWPTYKEFWTKK